MGYYLSFVLRAAFFLVIILSLAAAIVAYSWYCSGHATTNDSVLTDPDFSLKTNWPSNKRLVISKVITDGEYAYILRNETSGRQSYEMVLRFGVRFRCFENILQCLENAPENAIVLEESLEWSKPLGSIEHGIDGFVSMTPKERISVGSIVTFVMEQGQQAEPAK